MVKNIIYIIYLILGVELFSVPLTLAVPDLNEGISVYARWDALADYLKYNSGLDIRIKIVKSHKIIENGFKNHTISFAFVDPFWFVKLKEKKLCKPLVRVVRNGKEYYNSLLLVNNDSIYRNLFDLKGKEIALENPFESAGGYFLPVIMLNRAGVKREDFSNLIFSDSYISVLKGVAFGKLAAGFVSSNILLDKKAVPYRNNVRVIMRSFDIPQGVIVARFDMAEKKTNKLKRAIIEMKDNDSGKTLLADTDFTSFVEVKAGDYVKIKENMKYLEPDFVSSE